MRFRAFVVVAACAAQMVTMPGGSEAAGGRVVDLRRVPSWTAPGDSHIAPAGDVNGDGEKDALVASCSPRESAGRVRVVWGPFSETDPPPDGPGYAINGADPEDYACILTTAPVGDVNGDGLDDVVVGAEGADPPQRSGGGTVYVIFGKTGEEDVDLARFDNNIHGNAGYRIDGPFGGALAGNGVDAIGDMNLDGLADVLVGAPFAGAAYVVFGKATPTPVDLMTFDLAPEAEQGFRIYTYFPNASDGYSVAGAGDVNGDGRPDVIVGVIPNDYSTGSAFVVFGKQDAMPVDTRKPSEQSFKIKGVAEGERTGDSVGAAGDVNGDGLDDVIVGSHRTYSCCRGRAVVLFGKSNTRQVSIGDLGRGGFKIAAPQELDSFGAFVGGVGDVNGDGLDDVAVGAPWLDYAGRGRTGPGGVFVVYGKTSATKVLTARLGDRGLVIVGRRNQDLTGFVLGTPGDMNEDGVPDLMITGGRNYLLWLDPPSTGG